MKSRTLIVLRKTDVQLDQVVPKARIDIRYHTEDTSGLAATLTFEGQHTVLTEDQTKEVDALWEASWLLRPQRSSRSGVMHPGCSVLKGHLGQE